jgi:hypothetical protein
VDRLTGTVSPGPRGYTAPAGRPVLYANARIPATTARHPGAPSQLKFRIRVEFPTANPTSTATLAELPG